ncbi:hypothetical protein [Leeuwenhoekiella marinoflava]|uniref:hypothetical protein n=1 Tax=Leeuwenhoekiella marinoflava TaxID=988 RepID=UPI003003A2F0
MRTIVNFILALLFMYSASSQEDIIANEALAEKVYLQLDRNTYSTGETIWFKALVTQAIDHAPSPITGVLHVELLNPSEKVILEKQVEITHGIGANFIDIGTFFTPGRYQIRAYTEWNKNFKEAFIYTMYVDILDNSIDLEEDIISLINYSEASQKIKVLLNPQILDTGVTTSVGLNLLSGDTSEKYSIKKNKNGNFLFEEKLSPSSKFIKLKLYTESGKSFTKTFNLSEPAIDIQFMAESGNFVAGFNNVISFKAIDQNGNGVQVAGELVSKLRNFKTSFKSDEYGLGRVHIFPNSGEEYEVNLTEDVKNTKISYNFPAVDSKGIILSIKDLDNKLGIGLKSNIIENDTLFISISRRGLKLGEIAQFVSDSEANFILLKESLPEGILVFTLKDKNGNALAERLFFNLNNEKQMPISLKTNKQSYKSKEEVSLVLSNAKNKKDTLEATASVLVVPKDFVCQDENIRSYFLLSSELKGKIENPKRFFNPENESRLYDLDNLMLTQGWRKYIFTSTLENDFKFKPEQGLILKGKIGALLDKDRMKKDVIVSLMTFGEEQDFFKQETDSLGRFNFLLPNYSGYKKRILLQTQNQDGRQRDYTLTLDEPKIPQIDFRNEFKTPGLNKKAATLSNKYIIKKKDAFDYDSSINELDEVLINTYKMTAQRQKVADLYGKPDVVIDGDKIRAKEESWSYGLFSVLRASFGNALTFFRVTDESGTYLRPRVQAGDETLVVIDGETLPIFHYHLLSNLSAADIKSVEILKVVSSNYQQLYRDTYNSSFQDSSKVPVWGSILAIYTHSGNGIFTAYRSRGILKTTIPVFAASKAFYSPKYSSSDSAAIKNDNRKTLYWNPTVTLKGNEPINLSFYNGDIPGTKTIIIEALSQDGKLGYKQLDYNVNE